MVISVSKIPCRCQQVHLPYDRKIPSYKRHDMQIMQKSTRFAIFSIVRSFTLLYVSLYQVVKSTGYALNSRQALVYLAFTSFCIKLSYHKHSNEHQNIISSSSVSFHPIHPSKRSLLNKRLFLFSAALCYITAGTILGFPDAILGPHLRDLVSFFEIEFPVF